MDNKRKSVEFVSLIINIIMWGGIIILIFIFTQKSYNGAMAIVDNLLNDSDENFKEYVLVLEESTKYNDVLEILEENEIIFSSTIIKVDNLLQNVVRETIPSGTYVLNNRMDINEINSILADERIYINENEITVTILEGLNINEIATVLESKELVQKEEFIQIANTYDFTSEFVWLETVEENYLEGYLYPDTYNFYKDATSEDIIRKMLNRFNQIYTSIENTDSVDMTLNEVVTMASIIEKEISLDEERGKLSNLIHNRMKNDMTLNIPSTLVYVLNKREESLVYSDYQVNSPYNTYLVKGLPPKPICSPSIASIKAVFDQEEASYLYFINLEGSKEHLFTDDYNEITAIKEGSQ